MEVSQSDARAVSGAEIVVAGRFLSGSVLQISEPVTVKVGPVEDGSNKLFPPQKKTNTTAKPGIFA